MTKKTWLGLGWLSLLTIIMTLFLAACGDNTATSAPAATTAAAATTAKAAATTAAAASTTAAAASAATTAASGAAATTAASSGAAAQTVAPVPNGDKTGVTDSEILIGSWGPQSGPAAAYGTVDRTLDAYFKMINEQGGINGRKIRFIYQDDVYQASNTQAIVKKMVEQDKVFAFVGGIGTAPNQAVLDYLVQNKVPNIAPSTGSTILTIPPKPQTFGLLINYTIESTFLTQYAADELKSKKVAIFYQDDAFGKEGLNGIKNAAKTKGIDVVAEVSYQTTDKDFAAPALKLQQSNADTVIFWSVPGPTGNVLKEMQTLGYKPKMVMTAVLNDPQLLSLAGNAAEGAYTASWTPDPNGDDPKAQRYRDFMKKYAPNEPIGSYSQWAVAEGDVLVEALKRAGKDLSREGLIKALETFNRWNDGLANNVTYTAESRLGQTALYVLQAKGGKFAKVTDFIEVK
jgi:ABC-type branched-subunit amino acid transport system substrate-binding protein